MPSQQNLGIILENDMSENYFESLTLFTKYNDFLEVWSILAKNLTDFDPPKQKLNSPTDNSMYDPAVM